MEDMKPGIKTTEFWLTALVTVLGIVGPTLLSIYGSEAAFPQWAKTASILAGAMMSVLATLGYNRSRAALKSSAMETQARMEETKMLSEKNNGEGGFARLGVMCTVVLLTFFVTTSLGCGTFTLKKYDPETSYQIDKTIAHEKANAEMLMAPPAGMTLEQLAEQYKVLSDAEIARLEAWKAAEEAKKLEDVPPPPAPIPTPEE